MVYGIAASPEMKQVSADAGIEFRDREESRARLSTLMRRLRTSAIPTAYREGSFVAERLIWILKTRPRLTVDHAGEHSISAWASRSGHHAPQAGPTLMQEVEARMAAGVTDE